MINGEKGILKRFRTVLYIVTIMSIFASAALPSEECRKELAPHLKEFYEGSGLYWAVEFTGQMGFGTDVDGFSRDSVFGAFEYNPGKGFSMYLEAGARYFNLFSKGQNNRDNDSWGYPDGKIRFRLKEAYLKYQDTDLSASVGLITASIGDFFLLDERAFGTVFRANVGNFTFAGAAGSVVEDFTYGDKGWLKKTLVDWLAADYFQETGARFGDVNFAAASLLLYPGRSSRSSDARSSSEDEFETFDERTSFIEKIGLIFNYEFGDEIGKNEWIGEDRIYYGALASFDLGKFLHINTSIAVQDIDSYKALGWYLEGTKNINLGSAGSLGLRAAYLGTDSKDGEPSFAPSFTHLALGEIYGFEPSFGPLIIAEAKYSIPVQRPWDLSVDFYSGNDKTAGDVKEFDMILKIPFTDELRAYFFYCTVDADAANEPINYTGIEVRFTI